MATAQSSQVCVCVCVRRQACCVDVLDAPRTHVPDFWKKFEGTYIKLEKCAMPPKQSVETHSVWFLVPPPGAPRYELGPASTGCQGHRARE